MDGVGMQDGKVFEFYTALFNYLVNDLNHSRNDAELVEHAVARTARQHNDRHTPGDQHIGTLHGKLICNSCESPPAFINALPTEM